MLQLSNSYTSWREKFVSEGVRYYNALWYGKVQLNKRDERRETFFHSEVILS
jgi:hypothetical protein